MTEIIFARDRDISIREALFTVAVPAEPSSFEFIGTRAELAAHLIGRDAAAWMCVDYIIAEDRATGKGDGSKVWSVWRR